MIGTDPTRTARAVRRNTAPIPVLTVRGTVCSAARLATSANGVLRSALQGSRIRSKTTTES
jgi:hypothetical protein